MASKKSNPVLLPLSLSLSSLWLPHPAPTPPPAPECWRLFQWLPCVQLPIRCYQPMLQHVGALRCYGSQCSPSSPTTPVTFNSPPAAASAVTVAHVAASPADCDAQKCVISGLRCFQHFSLGIHRVIDAIRARAVQRGAREAQSAARMWRNWYHCELLRWW